MFQIRETVFVKILDWEEYSKLKGVKECGWSILQGEVGGWIGFILFGVFMGI